jgi:dihydropteroate synthase
VFSLLLFMARKLHIWKLKNRELQLGDRTLIMGVLNITPDSFSDGGKYLDPDRAYARAIQLEEQGADIIDVGAESTRPGAHPLSAAEEMQRLVPVLKRLRDKLSIPISVDTYKSEVAERALELGAEIINDPSGFTFDPQLVKPVVQYDAGVILNHMRGRPETWASLGPMPDVMGSIVKDLDAAVNRARHSGVDRLRIVIDPGIGFGKRREQNAEILARLGELARLELPILVGPSRKSFLSQSGLANANERDLAFATGGAVAAAILNGASIVRVHDVAEMKIVANVVDDVVRAMNRRAEEAREATAAETSKRRQRPIAAGLSDAAKPPLRPPINRPFEQRRPPESETGEARPERRLADDRPRFTRREDESCPAAGRSDDRREGERGPRPSFNKFEPRPEGESRPPRPTGEQREGGRGPRPAFKKFGGPREDRPSSGRPPGDRPRPPFGKFGGGREGEEGKRPPFRKFSGGRKSEGGDRPAFRKFGGKPGPKREGGKRKFPPRPPRDRE